MMELSINGINPIQIETPKACELLFGKRTLLIAGSAKIREHRRLIEDAINRCPMPCWIYMCRVQWKKTEGPSRIFMVNPSTEGDEYGLLFMPDNTATRVLMIMLIAAYAPSTMEDLVDCPNPILMLAAPDKKIQQQLLIDYAVIMKGFEDFRDGKVYTLNQN